MSCEHCNNDYEARQLSREYSLLRLQPNSAHVIQIRCNALFLFHDLQVLQPAALPRRSFDPTGAGDTLQVDLQIYYIKTYHLKHTSGLNLASFCKFETERMIDLDEE
jgi:hypothetical protein